MEVLGLHNIELGDERINRLILFVDISCVFELCSEMQKLLDLMFVFKNAVNPALDKREHSKVIIRNGKTYLELRLTHSAIEAVLERLVLEVEFNLVLIRAISDGDIEIDLDSSFGNGSKFVWL